MTNDQHINKVLQEEELQDAKEAQMSQQSHLFSKCNSVSDIMTIANSFDSQCKSNFIADVLAYLDDDQISKLLTNIKQQYSQQTQ